MVNVNSIGKQYVFPSKSQFDTIIGSKNTFSVRELAKTLDVDKFIRHFSLWERNVWGEKLNASDYGSTEASVLTNVFFFLFHVRSKSKDCCIFFSSSVDSDHFNALFGTNVDWIRRRFNIDDLNKLLTLNLVEQMNLVIELTAMSFWKHFRFKKKKAEQNQQNLDSRVMYSILNEAKLKIFFKTLSKQIIHILKRKKNNNKSLNESFLSLFLWTYNFFS